MNKLIAVMAKELLQLSRDRAGLLVLFVMPMALVLIMSLVQDSVLKATGESTVELLWVDEDDSPLSHELASRMTDSGAVELIRHLGATALTAEAARHEVAAGHYPFALILPAGLGNSLERSARQAAELSFRGEGTVVPPLMQPRLIVDPAVQQMFRLAVSNVLQRMLLVLEVRQRSQALSELLQRQLPLNFSAPGGLMSPSNGPAAAGAATDQPPLLGLTEDAAISGRALGKPNAVQHNVPAWTLFGIFFIVVPLSGLMIRERQNGTAQRLLTLPVSALTILGGRVCAFLSVGLGQFFAMLAVGLWILPALGTPALVVGPQWPQLLAVAIAASLAAISYGLLLGTLAGSYEQASMFGAVSVVIAAALGGVMVPLYVMPKVMQAVSVLSPLGWGLSAFQDVLIRGAAFSAILPELSGLLLFFGACLGAAAFSASRNRNRPA